MTALRQQPAVRPVPPPVDRAQITRRLAVLGMILLPWLIAPGRTQPDTKVDLTISPWRYVGRALDAWNGHAGLGELQNQAYGYLFPMGPVFGAAHSLGLPGWAAQRVWWGVLLVVAFTGASRLVQVTGVAGPGASLVAAAAYALCPRVLTLLAENSSEAWPMAVAPWLVLAARPLVYNAIDRRTVLRAVATSGLLAAALGGVNAAASGLILLLPFLYLLTHPVGRRRLGWWVLGAGAGALWWLLPLLVLGRYGYPFLDYIETASMTTAVTSVPNVLRGNSDWIAYILDSEGHPTWQGGWISAQSLVSILATCAVAGLGLAGLVALRGKRDHLARWGLLSVVLGTVFMAAGHRSVVGGPLADPVRSLLDGSLAPLRNVHKADALIRLPVVLGLAAVLDRLRRPRAVAERVLAVAVVVLVLAAMTPVWQGRMGDAGSYGSVPASWPTMASRVDADAARAGGSTLLWPDARTSTHTWGTTTDDPMSAYVDSPLVYRAAAPLGIPASTRMLDTADQLASSGRPQPGLAAGLARMGIARVVVRHSVASSVGAAPWRLLEQTLRGSPGFTYAGSTGTSTNVLTLWRVAGSRTVAAYSGHPLSVAGAPESSFDLDTVGLLPTTRAVRLVPPPDGDRGQVPAVVTDTPRWRGLNNGVAVDNGYSPTLLASDRTPTGIGAKDLPPAGSARDQPVRRLIGMSSWSASSSGADPFAEQYAGPSTGIAAAFDGDAATEWRSGDGAADQSLSFRPTGVAAVREVDVDVAAGPGLTRVGSLRLSVGSVRAAAVAAPAGGGTVRLMVPRATTGTVRIEIRSAGSTVKPVVAVREIRVPGRSLDSVIALPGRIDPGRSAILLRRDTRERTDVGRFDRAGEDPAVLRRQLDVTRAARVRATVWVRSTDGRAPSTACGAAGALQIGVRAIPLRVVQATGAGGLSRAIPCSGEPIVPRGRTDVSATPGPGTSAELILLSPDAAAAAAPAAVPASFTHSGRSGSSTLRVGASDGTRLVALTEGANHGWRATADGHRLTPVVVDGWRQGFRLPAGGPVTVDVSFGPTRWQRVGLGVGALAVLGLALLFALTVRTRRSSTAAAADTGAALSGRPVPSKPPVLWAPLIAVVVGVAVAGPAGALAAAAAVAVPRRWWARTVAGSMALAGLLLATLGVVDARSAGAVLGQLVGTFTLCLLARALSSGDVPTVARGVRPMRPNPGRPPG